MFGNILKKNNAYLLQRILTNVESLSFNYRTCYPVLVSANNKCAYSNFVIPTSHKQNFWTQNYVRYKTTTTGTKEDLKKESSTTDNVKVEVSSVAPLTRAEKLKKAVKEYGSTVIVFHVGISLISLGSCYLLVTSGLDVHKIFVMIGLDNWLTKSEIATSASTFAVAYAIHKVFAPVRIAITLTSVPFIVQYLRRIGFLRK